MADGGALGAELREGRATVHAARSARTRRAAGFASRARLPSGWSAAAAARPAVRRCAHAARCAARWRRRLRGGALAARRRVPPAHRRAAGRCCRVRARAARTLEPRASAQSGRNGHQKRATPAGSQKPRSPPPASRLRSSERRLNEATRSAGERHRGSSSGVPSRMRPRESSARGRRAARRSALERAAKELRRPASFGTNSRGCRGGRPRIAQASGAQLPTRFFLCAAESPEPARCARLRAPRSTTGSRRAAERRVACAPRAWRTPEAMSWLGGAAWTRRRCPLNDEPDRRSTMMHRGAPGTAMARGLHLRLLPHRSRPCTHMSPTNALGTSCATSALAGARRARQFPNVAPAPSRPPPRHRRRATAGTRARRQERQRGARPPPPRSCRARRRRAVGRIPEVRGGRG